MKTIPYLILLCLFATHLVCAQTFRVVNMVPNALSNETNQDSEPHITFNPNNPNEIIGSAFTPNPTGALATAPIYISQDGGNTWVLNNIVPSANGMTGDITVGLSRSNILYSGILFGGAGLQMQILRSNNYLGAATMGNLLTRNNEDQPFVEVTRPLGGSLRNNDLLYVGHNDFNAAAGRTASIEQSLNAATAPAPANLTTQRLELRATAGQDGPPIRTAAHPNGTVYAIFDRLTNIALPTITSDVIVVRDDNWGQGATPYNNLTDPSDGLAGRIVATGLTWTFNSGVSGMGQARIGDRFSIAVDPRNSQTVYIAFVDRAPAAGINTNRLHIQVSTDGGNSWSADLLTINNITIPQLAVNVRGEIGLLYQQLTGTAPNQQWVTRFRQSDDGGATWSNTVLHQAPSNTPAATFAPYLGDYGGLVASGKDFYGIFSGNNTPNNANFPSGVTYQRNANFGTNVLRNQTNTANVAISIDPFFFEAEQMPDDQDFYVRDWTDNGATFDIGLEPSTKPVFYRYSDVWNRRTDIPGGFDANDRPLHQDPHLATAGNNFAYARVHRKGTGSAETVTLDFLKSEFGTGSNYVQANATPSPTLAFAAGEQVKTMATGYEWTLVATTSSHVCMAVEISTPNDPVVVPTLLGRAPGWPTTDLSVLYDNNKAQRNMGVHLTNAGGGASGIGGSQVYYAVVHNAATFKRDMVLDFSPSKSFTALLKRPDFHFPQGEDKRIQVEGDQMLLKDMLPGENRWIGLSVPAAALKENADVSVEFTELVDNMPVNGFVINMKTTSDDIAGRSNTALHAELYLRMSKLFKWDGTADESKSAVELMGDNFSTDKYLKYLKSRTDLFSRTTKQLIKQNEGRDLFGLQEVADLLLSAIESGNKSQIISSHGSLNLKIDAFLTFLDKQNGDVADILQNIRWQSDIFKKSKTLTRMGENQELFKRSKKFEESFYQKKATIADYPKFLEDLSPTYEAVVRQYPNLKPDLQAMKSNKGNLQKLQKSHSDFLLKLSSI